VDKMWAKIYPLVQKTSKLQLFIAGLLFAALLGIVNTASASAVTGIWQKNGTTISVKTSDNREFFNLAQDNKGWYAEENAGKACEARMYFAADPRTSAFAASSGAVYTYTAVQAPRGGGRPVCTENDAVTQVTITGSKTILNPGVPGGTDATPLPTNNTGTPEPECDVGGLSFVICPMIKFMADATREVSKVLAGLLYVQPLSFNVSDSNTLYKAWSAVLSIANVLLAFAFLFVIFAQSTSMALSNYGVKKMLPRIIAAAILMNLSYYICALLVDLSNLAGVGISGLFAGVINGFSTSPFTSDSISKTIGNNVILEGVAGFGFIAVIAFFFLIPALLAVLAVLFTLAARIAIIVILVMVAPLAFAAWILPNTEKYFKKWYELFTTMLFLFPIVMAVFAGSAVASNIIQKAAITGPDVTGATPEITQNVLLPLIALLVQALPLFALPFLFKTAGGVLSRINDMAQNYGNRGRKAYQDSNLGKYRAMRKDEDRRLAQTGSYNGLIPTRRLQSAVNRKLNRNKAFNAATRGYGGFRTLDEARQTYEDQKKTQDMLSGDFDLAEAWVSSGGSNKHAAYEALSQAQKHKFDQMRRAGYHQRANSFSAALSLMADSGVGTEEDIQATMKKIDTLTPNREQAGVAQAGLNEYIRSAYRKSGRGDLVVRQGNLKEGIEAGLLETKDARLGLQGYGPGERDQGWNEISMPNLTRHGIGRVAQRDEQGNYVLDANGERVMVDSDGRASFKRWVQRRPENLRKVVASLDSMEQRAREQAEAALGEVGYADMDALRVQFGLRQGGGGGVQGPGPQGGGQGPQRPGPGPAPQGPNNPPNQQGPNPRANNPPNNQQPFTPTQQGGGGNQGTLNVQHTPAQAPPPIVQAAQQSSAPQQPPAEYVMRTSEPAGASRITEQRDSGLFVPRGAFNPAPPQAPPTPRSAAGDSVERTNTGAIPMGPAPGDNNDNDNNR
jgi:hypothetical protein